MILSLVFVTEHGTIFTGTINPYSGKSMIYSRSLQPRRFEVFTSLQDQSDFYTGLYYNLTAVIQKFSLIQIKRKRFSIINLQR